MRVQQCPKPPAVPVVVTAGLAVATWVDVPVRM
jgi:hypothetical protein